MVTRREQMLEMPHALPAWSTPCLTGIQPEGGCFVPDLNRAEVVGPRARERERQALPRHPHAPRPGGGAEALSRDGAKEDGAYPRTLLLRCAEDQEE